MFFFNDNRLVLVREEENNYVNRAPMISSMYFWKFAFKLSKLAFLEYTVIGTGIFTGLPFEAG